MSGCALASTPELYSLVIHFPKEDKVTDTTLLALAKAPKMKRCLLRLSVCLARSQSLYVSVFLFLSLSLSCLSLSPVLFFVA
jgi:hypothetical protein